ncbi:MAG TPA: hypothetical protein ENJ55_07335 [Rhizobiales bacterium]|nr:hypothetical protein [Hyphomicrobiales bacterium]
MEQLTELDYESIENAVMATARGRWFLAEHKKRHGGTDTPALLEAIGRLEKVISSINKDFPAREANAMESAFPAVAAVTAAPEITPAQDAMPSFEPATDFTPDLSAEQPQSPAMTDENMQFFANDEDLFADDANSLLPDAPDANNDIAQDTQASPDTETAKTASERFKIFRTDEQPAQDDGNHQEVETEKLDFASPDIPDPVMQPTTEEKDRIVVIRNASSEDIDIPLMEDFEELASSDNSAVGKP